MKKLEEAILSVAKAAEKRRTGDGRAIPALYHYTDTKGLLGIVQSGCLWASDVRCMNDTLELEAGLARFRIAAKAAGDDVAYALLETALSDP
jgi:hypothetical protein